MELSGVLAYVLFLSLAMGTALVLFFGLKAVKLI